MFEVKLKYCEDETNLKLPSPVLYLNDLKWHYPQAVGLFYFDSKNKKNGLICENEEKFNLEESVHIYEVKCEGKELFFISNLIIYSIVIVVLIGYISFSCLYFFLQKLLYQF